MERHVSLPARVCFSLSSAQRRRGPDPSTLASRCSAIARQQYSTALSGQQTLLDQDRLDAGTIDLCLSGLDVSCR